MNKKRHYILFEYTDGKGWVTHLGTEFGVQVVKGNRNNAAGIYGNLSTMM